VTYWQHPAGGNKDGGEAAGKEDERTCHGLIQISLSAMGLKVLGETAGAIGRADMSIFLPHDKALVIEIKHSRANPAHTGEDLESIQAEALQKALKAITEKDYGGPHRISASEVIGLGLAVYGRNEVLAGFLDDSELRQPLVPCLS
jgi:hypothetical protein